MNVGVCRGYRHQILLELELHIVVSHPVGCWEQNSDSLQGQYTFLTAVLSLCSSLSFLSLTVSSRLASELKESSSYFCLP